MWLSPAAYELLLQFRRHTYMEFIGSADDLRELIANDLVIEHREHRGVYVITVLGWSEHIAVRN